MAKQPPRRRPAMPPPKRGRGAPRVEPDTDTLAGRIGLAIRQAREAAGLDVDALAEQLDMSRVAVYEWERGVKTPPIATLYTLAAALGVHPHDLLPD